MSLPLHFPFQLMFLEPQSTLRVQTLVTWPQPSVKLLWHMSVPMSCCGITYIYEIWFVGWIFTESTNGSNWRTALRRFLSWKCCWCLGSLPRTIPSALFSLKRWLPSGFDHWNLGKHFCVLYFSTVASSSLLGHLREISDSLILSLVSSFF